MLLHYAGDPPAGAPQGRPVLLVHGANKDANFWWDPSEDGANKGLPQRLRDQGCQVFALTFAHNQDDNLLQAEQISNCIDRIKELTGQSQIDLIAHSKGGVSSRIYVTDEVKESWMHKFKGELHRLALVWFPQRGESTTPSATPLLTWPFIANQKRNFSTHPCPWDNITVYGVPQDCRDRSFDAQAPNYFPASASFGRAGQ